MKYEFDFEGRLLARVKRECHWGFFEVVLPAFIASLATDAAVATGITLSTAAAGTIGTIGTGVLTGAALGAGEAAITGGDPGMGALGGAISGGTLSGLGPVAGDVLGSAFAGDVVAGAAGGTLSAAATGGDLGQGALGGAVSGGISYGMGELTSGADGTADPNAAGPPGGPGPTETGAPVEAVTVHPLSAPAGVSLAGANTGGGGTTKQPGTESVTVEGTATPPPAPVTLAGVVNKAPTAQQKTTTGQPQGPLSTVQPGSQLGGAQTPGAQTPGAMSINAVPPTSEQVVVHGTPTAADLPSGGVAPTAAGFGVSPGATDLNASDLTDDDPNKKKDESFLDKLGNKTEDLLSNPLALVAGGALLADATGLFHGGNPAGNIAGGTGANADQLVKAANADTAQADKLTGLADKSVAQGQQLQDYLTSGGLPPGAQATLDAEREAGRAKVIQTYANMGSTGSSSMFQDLQNVEQTVAATRFDMATKLFEEGTTVNNYASDLYSKALAGINADTAIYTGLLQDNITQDNNLSAGVNNFVSALANLSKATSPTVTA